MTFAHVMHGHGAGTASLAPLLALVVLAAGYVALATRRRADGLGWSTWRTASFLLGCTMLALGLAPHLLPDPAEDFRGHVLQHLLIGMLGPLALVLAAPITLVLRSVTPRRGRLIGRVLRSHTVHLIANPVSASALSLGGLVGLYVTPLYAAATRSPMLHHLVHLHFLAAGYLFAWVIAGPDPAPRRPSVPARLVVLGVAIAVHSTLSQLMYAGALINIPVPPDQRRGGAALMYYGGDIAELLLAFALVATWRGRPNRRTHKRPAAGHDRPSNACEGKGHHVLVDEPRKNSTRVEWAARTSRFRNGEYLAPLATLFEEESRGSVAAGVETHVPNAGASLSDHVRRLLRRCQAATTGRIGVTVSVGERSVRSASPGEESTRGRPQFPGGAQGRVRRRSGRRE
jgi:putative membrane protein